MSKLAGKVAVVTGASKGIGAAISKALAAEGASVVVNYSSSKEGADNGSVQPYAGRASTCRLRYPARNSCSRSGRMWPDRRLHNRSVLRLSGPDVSSNNCARAIAGPRVR